MPQIVVQMPVYKESLEEVIQLTYFNVKKAMDYYKAKGGRVKYIICDDGFQVGGKGQQHFCHALLDLLKTLLLLLQCLVQ